MSNYLSVPKRLLGDCAAIAMSYAAIARVDPYVGRDPASHAPRDPGQAMSLVRQIDEALEAEPTKSRIAHQGYMDVDQIRTLKSGFGSYVRLPDLQLDHDRRFRNEHFVTVTIEWEAKNDNPKTTDE